MQSGVVPAPCATQRRPPASPGAGGPGPAVGPPGLAAAVRRRGLAAAVAIAPAPAPALAEAGATLAVRGWALALALAMALAAVAALAALAAALWMRRRSEHALHAARRDAQASHQLVEACRWATDRDHRVTTWQPGTVTAVPAWAQAWQGLPLWDLLERADDGPALRPLLEAGRALAGVAVRPRGGAADTAVWALRAWPLLDAQGGLAGHVGTLGPSPAAASTAAEDPLADALLQAWPGPAWVLAGARVQRCNAQALRVAGGVPQPSRVELGAALPAELRPLVAALVPDAPAQTQGRWCARLVSVAATDAAAAPPLTALLLWPAPGGAEADGPDESQSLTYAVSHDLRAPIRVVEGFARIVKEDHGAQLDRIGHDHLDRVLAAAARMNQMIDALLALARLASQPLARQPVNLSQLAGYIVEELRRQQPQPTADVTIEPGMVVQGDPMLLRIALENLLGNAWKYSARCERRVVAFGRAASEGCAGTQAFVVRDNGAGFDMRFVDRLFGVFQRLHSASDYAGTGIGLASVKRIVARHGGQIRAEGEVGRGAQFTFTLAD
jgi:signal transduction histidine kinase